MAKRIEDWTTLPGVHVELRLNGLVTCSGTVEWATNDGKASNSYLQDKVLFGTDFPRITPRSGSAPSRNCG